MCMKIQSKVIKLQNQTVITHSQIYVANIEITNGTFTKITKVKSKPNLTRMLMPGFIDIHTHGGYGFSFNDLAKNKINKDAVTKYLHHVVAEGVTSVFATTVTCPIADLNNIYKSFISLPSIDPHHIICGWHIEGPFISQLKHGAHNKKYIVPMNDKYLSLLKSFKQINKILTFAPEYKNNHKYTKQLSSVATISLGHSIASAHQTCEAISNGARHFTHLFNSMPKFEHRNPTIINVAIKSNHTYCEIISDLIHIEPLAVQNIYHIFGANRIILITDTLSCKGLKNGRYMLGSMPINKHDNIATLQNNKNIAGSIQPYIKQLQNFYKTTKCNVTDLVKISSYNAAKSLNLLNHVGQIQVGYKANFVIVDNNINLKATYLTGEKIV